MAQVISEGAAPIFEFEAHIRYSEVDHRGLLTLPALINYFQDASTFQSEMVGMGMTWLKEQRRGWLLTHWQIVVDRYPKLCEPVSVGTFASGFRGVTATRYFFLRDAEGSTLARAKSTWAYMDFGKGRPTRPEPAQLEAYGTAEALAMPDEERRVRGPEHPAPCEPVVVRRGQIDTNEHVNNGQYVQMALEVLPRETSPHLVRVDYRRAAVLSDTVCPAVSLEADRTVVELDNEQGEPFALVEFV